MKNKKVLLYYFLEFIFTILFFLTMSILIFKITIFNKNYFINKLEKANYYHEFYLDIYNDYENYIMQSGFDNTIIKDLFTEEDLKKVINKMVDNFYEGKDTFIETDSIKEKLEFNMEEFFKTIKVTITDENSLLLFKDEIVNIYENKFTLNKYIIKYCNSFYKVKKITTILLLIFIVLDIGLYLLIRKFFRKITLSIPFLSSILLFLLIYIFFVSKINIQSILFWNNYTSKVIKYIFTDFSNLIKYVSIFGILLEFLIFVLFQLFHKKI